MQRSRELSGVLFMATHEKTRYLTVYQSVHFATPKHKGKTRLFLGMVTDFCFKGIIFMKFSQKEENLNKGT